jgi:tetratricopeptide (TPR) repeat protein
MRMYVRLLGPVDVASDRGSRPFAGSANRTGQAMALADVGYSHAMLGNIPQALSYCEQALPGLPELDPGPAQLSIWDTLGYTHHQLGDHQQAIAYYRREIDHCRQIGDRFNEACVLDTLGDILLVVGDVDRASEAWGRTLPILEEFNHAQARHVRVKLFADLCLGPASGM